MHLFLRAGLVLSAVVATSPSAWGQGSEEVRRAADAWTPPELAATWRYSFETLGFDLGEFTDVHKGKLPPSVVEENRKAWERERARVKTGRSDRGSLTSFLLGDTVRFRRTGEAFRYGAGEWTPRASSHDEFGRAGAAAVYGEWGREGGVEGTVLPSPQPRFGHTAGSVWAPLFLAGAAWGGSFAGADVKEATAGRLTLTMRLPEPDDHVTVVAVVERATGRLLSLTESIPERPTFRIEAKWGDGPLPTEVTMTNLRHGGTAYRTRTFTRTGTRPLTDKEKEEMRAFAPAGAVTLTFPREEPEAAARVDWSRVGPWAAGGVGVTILAAAMLLARRGRARR